MSTSISMTCQQAIGAASIVLSVLSFGLLEARVVWAQSLDPAESAETIELETTITAPDVQNETLDTETSSTDVALPEASSGQSADLGSSPVLDATADWSNFEPQESWAEQQLQLLQVADQYYLGGQFSKADRLYRQAKPPFEAELIQPDETIERPEPLSDPALLSPAGRVYWREHQTGLEKGLSTQIQVPLELLVERHPEFLPAQVTLARLLDENGQPVAAAELLENAVHAYPNQAVLTEAYVLQLARLEEWVDASLIARQFALFNPEHPDRDRFHNLADQNLESFQKDVRDNLVANTLANVIVGAAGYALTGGLLGPFSALDSAMMLVRGESGIGSSISNSLQEQLDLIEDPEIVGYVDGLGQRLAAVAGRDEFDYEFHVIREADLNAFALPGGKIFVNVGAIAKTKSEAELAGLLAHEIAHAVLSHGFQLVSRGNLLANVTQFVPYGGTVANLIVLNYSRNMERQADELGTEILAAAGYAADGVYNLMQVLAAENEAEGENVFAWLLTHPQTSERLENLQRQIIDRNLNRYAYEGVLRHQAAQAKAESIVAEIEREEIEYNEVYQRN